MVAEHSREEEIGSGRRADHADLAEQGQGAMGLQEDSPPLHYQGFGPDRRVNHQLRPEGEVGGRDQGEQAAGY